MLELFMYLKKVLSPKMVKDMHTGIALEPTDQQEVSGGSNVHENAGRGRPSVVSGGIISTVLHPSSLIATSARFLAIVGGGIAFGASINNAIGGVLGGGLGFCIFLLSEKKA